MLNKIAACNLVFAGLVFVFGFVDCHAQDELKDKIQKAVWDQLQQKGGIQIRGGQVIGFVNQRSQPGVTDSGASLKTDPDLEATLEKAERYREEKQFGIAAKLWQSVLESSGDALFSSDGKIYYSLAEQVEKIIASLPVESGLASYRITCLLYTSPSPRDRTRSRMPSSA